MRYTKQPDILSGIWVWWVQNQKLRRFVALLLWTPLVVAGGFQGCAFLVSKAFEDMCGNDIANVYPSPDGALKAVVFSRNCGATTGYSTQISVLPVSEQLPNKSGNIFTAKAHYKEVTYSKKGTIPIKGRWLSNTELQIAYPSQAEVFQSETRVNVQAGSFDSRTVTLQYKTFKAERPKN